MGQRRPHSDSFRPAGFALEHRGGPGEAWADWLSTRYEQKALREGRQPHYLTFRRL